MSKKKIILFGVCLALLLALQIKFILPYVNKVVASDLFLEESKDQASALPISNDMTKLAFTFCNNHIRGLAKPDSTVVLPANPTRAWSLGNYDYIVNADVEIGAANNPNQVYHYACRIQYKHGDDTSSAEDINSWSIDGISGLPKEF